jgi:hypothetical protein
MQHIPEIQDLIIEECIPSCESCPSIWTNENTKHRIVCRCKKCKHGILGEYGLNAPLRQNTYDSIASGELDP